MLAYLLLLALANGLGMAFGRGSSDALFFKRFGVEYLPHMFFLTGVLLVLFSTIYVEFTDRVSRVRMLLTIMAILALVLLGNWLFMAGSSSAIPFAVYFLCVSVAAEIVAVHFNLYVSQFFDFNQSKRLNPLIDAGSRLGRVLGGLLLVLVAKTWPTEVSVLLWVGVIVCSMACVALYHRGTPRRPRPPVMRKRKPFADAREGLRFARHSPLLQLTGVSVFLLIILVSIQDYIASTIISNHYTNEQDLAAFFGWFFAITNATVLLLQLALTNHLVHRFGLKLVNLIFPSSTVFSFVLLSLSASFYPALFGRFNYMGMLPAFRTPVFNLFYTALPRYIQGRARAMAVGLILPLGLGCSGLMLLWVPKELVGAPLAVFGIGLALAYLYIETRKNKVYSKTLLGLIQHQVFSDKKQDITAIGRFGEEEARRVVELTLNADNVEAARAYAGLLITHAPEIAAQLLRDELQRLPPQVVEDLMRELAPSNTPLWKAAVQDALQHENARVRILAASLLETLGEQARLSPLLPGWLQHSNPLLQAQAARLVLRHPELMAPQAAEATLASLLQGEPGGQICALNMLAELGGAARRQQAQRLLDVPATRVRAAAVRCCAALSAHEAECSDILYSAARDPEAAVRIASAQALGRLSQAETRLAILQALLGDAEFAVRRAAQLAAASCMPHSAAAYASALATYYDRFPLQMLLCSHLAQSSLHEKSALLAQAAQTHLSAAYGKKMLALKFQADAAGDLQFLALVLTEDAQQHIDLVLEILSLQDASGLMLSVQAALKSENRRLRAQALESLRNVADTKFLLDLCAFLEMEFDHAPLLPRSPELPLTGREALQWCVAHGSVWLRQCAMAMLHQPTEVQR